MTSESVQYRKAAIYIIIKYFPFSLLYLSFAGNLLVYTPTQGTNRENYFNHIIYKGENAGSGGKKHLSVHFLLQRPRLFHFFHEEDIPISSFLFILRGGDSRNGLADT